MNYIIWGIIGLSVAGVILRPWGVREVYPAAAGALLLVVSGLVPPGAALRGAGQGWNVYLFLAGMMLLAEMAREQGLFGWAADLVARHACGSAARLFAMIYGMAVVITVFLSNDATAVVFTPAVAAMARAVKAERPLPFLLVCAFVANAASFVLPISNPANLVVYRGSLPALLPWLARFALPSVFAIAATFLLLWLTQRKALMAGIALPEIAPELSRAGRHTGYGLIAAAALLTAASGFGIALGPPTLLAGIVTAVFVLVPARQAPWALLRNIPWSILPLVAALFVMVAALDRTGASLALGRLMGRASPWGTGIGLGVVANLVNNLPAGLLAGHAALHASASLRAAALIGVDLGPNLSVTGSLATILWLLALRREGLLVTPWQFLRLGIWIMPVALILALFGLVMLG